VNPSKDLDEGMLKSIADETGGHYFRAHDSNELKKIYALIDRLEPVDRDIQTFRPVQSLFVYPLGLSIFFACLVLLLYGRRM
jgi:Ca-activated chloride channel family protein